MTKSAEKIPPQNLDAEKSLLGAILISEDVISDVALYTRTISTTKQTVKSLRVS